MSSDNLEKLTIETSDLLGDPELIVDGVDIPDNEWPSPFSNDAIENVIPDDKVAETLADEEVEKDEVTVLVTHSNLPNRFPDIRLKKNMTIEEIKNKLMFKVGTPVEYQCLVLKENERTIIEMEDNSKLLKSYNVIDGQEIHVMDTDPNSLSIDGGLTDVDQVNKYKMSDEDYNNRGGTVREHLKEEKYKEIVDKVEESMSNINNDDDDDDDEDTGSSEKIHVNIMETLGISTSEEEMKEKEEEPKEGRGGTQRKRGGTQRRRGGTQRKRGGTQRGRGGTQRKRGGTQRGRGGTQRGRGGTQRGRGGTQRGRGGTQRGRGGRGGNRKGRRG